MHKGMDYLVNRHNPGSRTFTVTFLSKQANSTENVIELAGDTIFEGNEAFCLRIVATRFIGEAAAIFVAPPTLTNTVADVIIEDDDCKFMNTPCIICYFYNYMHVMHALFSPTVVEVSWIIAEPIAVIEGERDPPELFAQAFGVYAAPIEIGVVCAEVIATGVPSGADTILNTDTLEHQLSTTLHLI